MWPTEKNVTLDSPPSPWASGGPSRVMPGVWLYEERGLVWRVIPDGEKGGRRNNRETAGCMGNQTAGNWLCRPRVSRFESARCTYRPSGAITPLLLIDIDRDYPRLLWSATDTIRTWWLRVSTSWPAETLHPPLTLYSSGRWGVVAFRVARRPMIYIFCNVRLWVGKPLLIASSLKYAAKVMPVGGLVIRVIQSTNDFVVPPHKLM